MKQRLKDCNELFCHVHKYKFTCVMLLTLDHNVVFCLLLSQWSFYNIYVNFIVSALRAVIISYICIAFTAS